MVKLTKNDYDLACRTMADYKSGRDPRLTRTDYKLAQAIKKEYREQRRTVK